jgi:hypothetical protein
MYKILNMMMYGIIYNQNLKNIEICTKLMDGKKLFNMK